MSDLNVFSCTGNLGGDIEMKDINGKAKGRYRIAIAGRKDQTTWLTCDHWEPHPNLIPHLTKGKKVALSGRIEEQGWAGKDGQPKTALVFVVNNLTLIGSKEPERRPGVVSGAPRRPQWEQDADQTPF